MRKLSISKVELADACLYSFRPDVETPHSTSNPAMDLGNEVHAGVEAFVGGNEWPDMSEEAARIFDQWQLYYQDTGFPLALCEAAIAFNVVTREVRLLGFGIGREYAKHGAGPDDVCGSVDLVCMRNGMLTVYDWKTGAQRQLTKVENPQVRAYGALLAKLLGENQVMCITVVVNEDGVFEYSDLLLDVDPVLSYISNLAEEAETFEPSPKPGTHCATKYCNLAATCPALHGIIKTIPVPLTTKADIANTIEKLYALEAQRDAIWKLVDARVTELGEDIPLSNNKAYGWKEQLVDTITYDDAASQILAKRGIKAAVKTSLTKKSLEEAVKAVAPPRGKAAMMKDVLAELAEFDCLEKRPRRFLGVK